MNTVLQSIASNRGHSTKFSITFWQLCDTCLTTFWWLPFKLANQNARARADRVVKLHVGFPTSDNIASHSPGILIGQIQRQTIRKLSKANKKLYRVAKVTRAWLLLTVFAFGMRNSPGSSTSAVDVVKLLRKRHLSSNRKELKNEVRC